MRHLLLAVMLVVAGSARLPAEDEFTQKLIKDYKNMFSPLSGSQTARNKIEESWEKGRAIAVANGATTRGTVVGKLLEVEWETGGVGSGVNPYSSGLLPDGLKKFLSSDLSEVGTLVAFESRRVITGKRKYQSVFSEKKSTSVTGEALELRALFIDLNRLERSFLSPWVRSPEPTFPKTITIDTQLAGNAARAREFGFDAVGDGTQVGGSPDPAFTRFFNRLQKMPLETESTKQAKPK